MPVQGPQRTHLRRPHLDRNWDTIDEVVRIAGENGATPAQVALSIDRYDGLPADPRRSRNRRARRWTGPAAGSRGHT
ncbi:hypothetical protein [Streptomyces sp. NPDC088196]|uniref:hypothetical protein n=1 Tax=Streptomyces sp. NPDC088196 TaxID=3154868 RepID=UPI00344C810E